MSGRSNARILVPTVVLVLCGLGVWWLLSDPETGPDSLDSTPSESSAADAATGEGPGKVEVQASNAASKRVALDGESSPETPKQAGDRGNELWGRVLRKSDDQPIAGAEVELLFADGDQFWNLDLRYGDEIESLARVTTDAEGKFRFDVVPTRQHRIHVSAAGYPRRVFTGRCGGGALVIHLGQPASLDGIVVDKKTRAPIVAAAVTLAVRGGHSDVAAGKTDAAGRFHLNALPEANVFVQVVASGYPETWKEVNLLPGKNHEVTVEVAAGRVVRGLVLDGGNRKPLAGVEISSSWTFGSSVQSGADGTFALTDVSPKRDETMYLRSPGYASVSKLMPLGEDGPIVVTMVRGGVVRGRVIEAGGKPAKNIYIGAGASYMERPGYEHTDWIRGAVEAGTGYFEIRGLHPTHGYWLFLRGPGYGTRVYALPRVVPEGDLLDVGDLVMKPAGVVMGRLVDETGKPWPQIDVGLSGANSDSITGLGAKPNGKEVSQFRSRSVTSDADGRFRFGRVAGGRYGVSARLPGGRVAIQVEIKDGQDLRDVVLTAARGKAIAGTIQFAGGEKFKAERVVLEAHAKGKPRVHTNAGEDGSFRFEGLTEESYSVRVAFAQGLGEWTIPRVEGIKPGTETVRIVAQRGAYVSGQVVDAQGKPCRGQVWLTDAKKGGGGSLHATDKEGRFRILVPRDFRGVANAVPAGKIRMTAAVKVEGVVSGQSDVRIQLSK